MKIGFKGYNSSEIGLLNRVAELARRFGLRPSEADASLCYIEDPKFECGAYLLDFQNRPDAPGTEKGNRFDKMMVALGCNERGGIKSEHLDLLEDVVERAILLSPRARPLG